MNSPILILVAVATLLLVKAEPGDNPGTHSLTNLGQVDGKNYFYEHGISERNWTEAGNYCLESGMQLATIETQTQADFLKSKYSRGGFTGSYWTAGCDAHLPREFTWNTTGTVPTEINGLPWNVWNLEYQTCVVYYAHTYPELFLIRCSELSLGTLCQN